jgi:hypothetical protein
MVLKDKEIKAILAEVSASLAVAKKNEVAKLSKAVGEPSPDQDDSASAPAAPEATDSAPAPESADAGGPPAGVAPDASASPDASAPPADASASAPGMDASASPDASAGDPAAEASVSPEQLVAEYSKLDDESLKSHYMACKQAVFARMEQSGAGADQSAPPAGPDASAGAPPAGPEASMPPPAMKGELAADGKIAPPTSIDGSGMAANGTIAPPTSGNGSLEQWKGPGANTSAKTSPASPNSAAMPGTGSPKPEVAKSETEELQAKVELLEKALEKTISLFAQAQPIRRAVTSVAALERTESLAKTEAAKPAAEPSKQVVSETLSGLIRGGKLSKADKQKVLDFYERKVEFAKIAHLFPTK